jgi:HEPN domain-containing protein
MAMVRKLKLPPIPAGHEATADDWRNMWPTLLKAFDAVPGREQNKLVDFFSGFYLTAGLAVETALKARLRRAGKPNKRTHDLVDLAEKAGLALSTWETNLLRRLSDFVWWAAKYPEPSNKPTLRREVRDRDLHEIEKFLARVNAP